jgi:hypothetical protein
VDEEPTPLVDMDTSELVGQILVEAKELVSAHIADVRHELGDRLQTLGGALRVTMIAVGVVVVTAMLLSLSIVATLVALGLTWWAALWLVTGLTTTAAILLLLAARRRTRTATDLEEES